MAQEEEFPILFSIYPVCSSCIPVVVAQYKWNEITSAILNNLFSLFNFCSSVSPFSQCSGERDPLFYLVRPTSQPLPITDSVIYLMLLTCFPWNGYLELLMVKIFLSFLPRAFVFED